VAGNIRIINLRDYKLNEGEVLIKVDRSTALGNPFHMNNNSDEERDRVCNDYKVYFKNEVLNHFSRAIKILDDIKEKLKQNDVTLGCWCFPKRCHAETIKEYLENK
jgi:hypothetical protein